MFLSKHCGNCVCCKRFLSSIACSPVCLQSCFILIFCYPQATNAACYSYQYYCSRRFCVYPQPQCFCYKIYFKDAWCTHRYYEPVLKVYPGEDCGEDGWSGKIFIEALLLSKFSNEQQLEACKICRFCRCFFFLSRLHCIVAFCGRLKRIFDNV